MNIKRNLVVLTIGFFVLAINPVFADTLSSTNYRIENATIDGGGTNSNSTNYRSVDSIGAVSDSGSESTNYRSLLGFLWPAYPGVPAVPTLTNTGGTLYNSLDFVVATGGNSSDTQYAIAISSDDFTTSFYIQTDDTLGSSEAWQTYANWGSGAGERVTGLSPSTTYKIKVKARHGINTDTGFSATASASTTNPSLTITFSGVASGTSIAGETTTITTTANAISYGSLVVSTPAIAAHRVTITTNGVGGYTTTLQQDGNLRTSGAIEISPVSGSNSSPASWPTGITNGRFGYHTTDSVLCTGTTNRFSANDTYAALTGSPAEVACNTVSVTSEQTTFVYKLEIGSLQESGSYQNVLTYISSAQY